jgi:hypothetical protein
MRDQGRKLIFSMKTMRLACLLVFTMKNFKLERDHRDSTKPNDLHNRNKD